MSKKVEFSVFCLESYKVYKSLTGKQVVDLFRRYGVFEYLRARAGILGYLYPR